MTKTQRVLLIVACSLLTIPFIANAQTIDSYEARFYNTGAPDPISTYPFNTVDITCGQVPPPGDASTTINPTLGARIVWDDPLAPGSVCMHTPDSGAPIFALPIPGSYEATLIAVNEVGESGESNRAPFDTLNPPDAQMGARVVQ
jgi:hypothetical protein